MADTTTPLTATTPSPAAPSTVNSQEDVIQSNSSVAHHAALSSSTTSSYRRLKKQQQKNPKKYRCIHCASPCPALYRTWGSHHNIKLSSCTFCGALEVDPYCEREFLLVALDVILMRTWAYRHGYWNRAHFLQELLLLQQQEQQQSNAPDRQESLADQGRRIPEWSATWSTQAVRRTIQLLGYAVVRTLVTSGSSSALFRGDTTGTWMLLITGVAHMIYAGLDFLLGWILLSSWWTLPMIKRMSRSGLDTSTRESATAPAVNNTTTMAQPTVAKPTADRPRNERNDHDDEDKNDPVEEEVVDLLVWWNLTWQVWWWPAVVGQILMAVLAWWEEGEEERVGAALPTWASAPTWTGLLVAAWQFWGWQAAVLPVVADRRRFSSTTRNRPHQGHAHHHHHHPESSWLAAWLVIWGLVWLIRAVIMAVGWQGLLVVGRHILWHRPGGQPPWAEEAPPCSGIWSTIPLARFGSEERMLPPPYDLDICWL